MTKPDAECIKLIDEKVYRSEDKIEKKLDEIKTLLEKTIRFTWKAGFIVFASFIGVSSTAFIYLNNKVEIMEDREVERDKRIEKLASDFKYKKAH